MESEELGYESENFVSRLSAYAVVNSVYQGYNSIKEKNSYLKAGLETAENLTQPVLKKLDNTLHLDQRGVVLLDKIESTCSKVSDYYANTKDTAVETKKNFVDKPVNQLLDKTQQMIDRILPPQFPITPLEDDEEEDLGGMTENNHTEEEEEEEELQNPISRIKDMSNDVSRRLQNVVYGKIQNAELRKEESVAYVIDLIQDVAERIDDKAKIVRENASQVQNYLEEKKDEATHKLVIPAREIIEKQTADIKDKSVKMVIAVVSSITHIAQVVKKQLTNQVPSTAKLHKHLKIVTERTKESILKLKQPELDKYIELVCSTYTQVLHSVVELTSYLPTQYLNNIPLLTQLLPLLSKWRLSMATRFRIENGHSMEEEEEKNYY